MAIFELVYIEMLPYSVQTVHTENSKIFGGSSLIGHASTKFIL